MSFSFGATANSGQQQQQQPSVPSFSFTGASAAATPAAGAAPAPFSFGAPAAGSAAPAGGSSLFGNTQQQQAPQPSGGFSFGAKPAQPAASGGGLFGQSTNTAQPSTGLFGQSTNTAQPSTGLFGQSTNPTQPSTGLFGQSQSQIQPQAGGSSLFGQPQQQQQQQSSGLFGQSTQQPSTGGLFGQTSTTQPGGGLFGQSTSQPGGSSLFGGQQQQQQQQQSQPNGLGLQGSTSTSGQAGQSGITKTTKFTELPEQFQKKVEELDSWIKQQKQAGQGINTDDLGKAIWRTTTDIKSCTEESSALTHSLQNTAHALTALQTRFVVEEEDVRRLAEIWETYKSVEGRPGAMRVPGHREWPAEFFGRVARGLEERVGRYRTSIMQLNRVVASLSNESETPSPQAIAQTIHNHQNALVTLAAQLESLQVRMNGLKGAYAAEYRDRTGSMRDPFDVAREDKGLAPLRA